MKLNYLGFHQICLVAQKNIVASIYTVWYYMLNPKHIWIPKFLIDPIPTWWFTGCCCYFSKLHFRTPWVILSPAEVIPTVNLLLNSIRKLWRGFINNTSESFNLFSPTHFFFKFNLFLVFSFAITWPMLVWANYFLDFSLVQSE